jgi:ABC-type bacteriocin/lantibiotic exporter with double-glycine peptidase domain
LRVKDVLLAAVLLMTTACSPFQRQPWQSGAADFILVEGVPYLEQTRRDDCGAAALASLLAHRGIEVPMADIDAAVYTPVLRGALLADLENFARGRGMTTRSGRGDLKFLQQQIEAGRPVLVLIQTGFGPWSQPHYLVVFGFDQRRLLVHAGVAGSLFIEAGEFERRWSRMSRLFLYLE